MSAENTLSRLRAAWSRRDVQGVLKCFAADGEYHASVGPLPGARAKGHAEIRSLLEAMFQHDDGTSTEVCDLVTWPDAATWTWRYTHADGTSELGCDRFRFRGDLIVLKDAYRKVWTEAAR
ncbi:MAG: nuclear transport factor 2 family protein [Acidobacteriota bacterium]